jgi:hypothetical protein
MAGPVEGKLAQPGVYAPRMSDPDHLDPQLASRLADKFSARVLDAAELPPARASDLRESCEVGLSDDRSRVRLVCTITGNTYERPWDGIEATALSLVEEAAEDTAYLITRTRHYAWLLSRH